MLDRETCREHILSEDYRDFIGNHVRTPFFNSLMNVHRCEQQNVLRNAACAGLRGAFFLRSPFFQDGGHRIGNQQNGHNNPRQPQLAADAPARAPPGCRMILV